MNVTLKGCARCGIGHKLLEFKEFERGPIEVYVDVRVGVVAATHWATCPTNGEPILMAMTGLESVEHAG